MLINENTATISLKIHPYKSFLPFWRNVSQVLMFHLGKT